MQFYHRRRMTADFYSWINPLAHDIKSWWEDKRSGRSYFSRSWLPCCARSPQELCLRPQLRSRHVNSIHVFTRAENCRTTCEYESVGLILVDDDACPQVRVRTCMQAFVCRWQSQLRISNQPRIYPAVHRTPKMVCPRDLTLIFVLLQLYFLSISWLP